MSVKRDAAIRIFERRDGMSIADTARVVTATVGPVSRQMVSRWKAAWEKQGLYASQAKGGPAVALPQPLAETIRNESVTEDRGRLMVGATGATRGAQSQPESLQPRPKPMTMAQRRANAREHILADLRRGMYRRHAVARAGISLPTFYAWLNNDSDDWKAEVEAAESDAIADVVSALYEDATQSRIGQRAVPAAIFLERRHGAYFGRNKVQIEVEVRGGLDIRRVISDPSLIDKISEIEVAMQRESLAGPVIDSEVTALPPHVEGEDE